MNRVVSLTLAVFCIAALVNAQFGPPVGWDKPIIKKDANLRICRQWATSFESFDDFAGFDVTPFNNGAGSAHSLSQTRVRSGKYSHMAAITAIEDNQHTAYPSIQLYKNTRDAGGFSGSMYIEIWIWMDIAISSGQWVTLGRLSPDVGATPGARALTLDIGPDGYVQFGNAPQPGLRFHEYKNDRNLFPRRQWVNMTMFLNFDSTSGYTALWQDGKLQAVAKLEYPNAVRLNQLHFGLFAANLIPSGVIYNDDLTITEVTTLDKPCPAASWTMTLPPTRPPVVVNKTDAEEFKWLAIEDNGSVKASIAMVSVIIVLITYMFL